MRWTMKFVDEVGSAVLYKNIVWVSTTWGTITEADDPANFTIFHCRMSTIQPAWPVCTTAVWFHTRCWHFCSFSSHKTIPSLSETFITQIHSRVIFCGTDLSVGLSQVLVRIARISYKVKITIVTRFQSLESIVIYISFFNRTIFLTVYQPVRELTFYKNIKY